MAAVEIKVPSVGESVSEGVLSRWLKGDGEAVKMGDPLFELETDKATSEVPAEADGVLKIDVAEGETVDVGTTVGKIDTEAAPAAPEAGDKQQTGAKPAQEQKREAAQESATAQVQQQAPEAGPSPAETDGGQSAAAGTPSPSARRLAEESGVDLAQVQGSGKGGRITKDDVQSFLESRSEPPTAPKPEAKTEPTQQAPQPPPPGPSAQADGAHRRQTRQRLPLIRQKIGQRLVQAQQTAAMLTTFNEVDMAQVMAIRSQYKESFKEKHGVNLGFMSFFVKAAVEALKTFPAVNGYLDGQEIVYNHYYDIGVAVSTERGLMVPVIRDCDRLSFAEIENTIVGFAKKARDNQISVDDLQGGTFTITNGGVFGSLLSTPILNPPQSAILGMHAIQKRPVVIDDQIAIRPMMYLALSYDHRIIDGREAVSFLVRIKQCIENPERMMLDI